MELRHLRYFVAVAEERNYRKAAEKLRIAKPAISSQIMDLEDELGVRLLKRGAAGAKLTASGEAFFVEARKILELAEGSVAIARRAAAQQKSRLVIGYVAALSSRFITAALEQLRTRYPDIEITLADCPMETHPAALLAGEIDVGFEIQPMPALPASLESVYLRRMEILAAIGLHHPLAVKREITMADFAHQRILTISNPARTVKRHSEQMRQLLAQGGQFPGAFHFCDGFESTIGMIAAGAGVTLLPDVSAPYSEGVVFRPLRGFSPFHVTLAAICRRDDPDCLGRKFVADLVATVGAVAPAPIGT